MKKIIVIMILTILLVGCTNKKEDRFNDSLDESSTVEENLKDLDKENIGSNEVTLYLFYSSTCPHCHEEIEWLDSISSKYDYLKIVKYEASENIEKYTQVVTKMNIDNQYVPLTIIGDYYYVGFSSYQESSFIEKIENYSKFENCDMVKTILDNGDIDSCYLQNQKK